jgi:hypothetical protein
MERAEFRMGNYWKCNTQGDDGYEIMPDPGAKHAVPPCLVLILRFPDNRPQCGTSFRLLFPCFMQLPERLSSSFLYSSKDRPVHPSETDPLSPMVLSAVPLGTSTTQKSSSIPYVSGDRLLVFNNLQLPGAVVTKKLKTDNGTCAYILLRSTLLSSCKGHFLIRTNSSY